MDAFASVISNNLNIVMKVLTVITIVMSVPTMVFSFYGMNVLDLPLPYTWFPVLISVILAVIVAILITKISFINKSRRVYGKSKNIYKRTRFYLKSEDPNRMYETAENLQKG